MHDELENHIFYRLIKVLYTGTLIIFFIGALGMGISEEPVQKVDNDKSYFTCANGNSYLFKDANIYLWSSDNTSLNNYDDETAKNICTKSYELKGMIPSSNSYILTIVPQTVGSWSSVLAIWFFGILITYTVLNILRETLIYIIYGKKFTWDWFHKIMRSLNSHK